MMKYRIIGLILCAALLATSAACAAEKAGDSDAIIDSDTVTAAETEVQPVLPDTSYDGYSFRIYTRSGEQWVEDFYTGDESTGEILDDAVYERNLSVEEQFNIKISVIATAADAAADAIKTIMADDDAYDLIVPHARYTYKYAEAGAALLWNKDLPYVDLSQPWWDQNAAESLSINGKLYTAIGDISYKALGNTNALLFSKVLCDSYSLDYPYQLVLDGGWTFDVFEEYVKKGSADLNGDGAYDSEDDQFGYVTSKWVGPINILYIGGDRILSKDSTDIPSISLDKESVIDLYTKYFDLVDSHACTIVEPDNNNTQQAVFLSENRALFIDMKIDGMEKLRQTEVEFGIVPYPKYDESTKEYSANVDAGTNLLIVPITASDTDRTSAVIEALAYESWKRVTPVYYDNVISYKYSRDEESLEMLKIIRECRVFDLGYYFEFYTNYSSFGCILVEKNIRDYASYFAKYGEAAQKALEKCLKYYTE